jgi:hypothetical protein
MNQQTTRLIRVSLTAVVILLVAYVPWNNALYQSLIVDPYHSLGLLTAFFMLVIVTRSWKCVSAACAAASLFLLLDLRFFYSGTFLHHPRLVSMPAIGLTLPVPLFSFLGLSSSAVLACKWIWEERTKERKILLATLAPAVTFGIALWASGQLVALTAALHPKTFDLFLFSFDSSLAIQPSFAVGQWFLHWLTLGRLSVFVYIALPVPLGVVYATKLRNASTGAMTAMLSFIVAAPIGFVFYNLLPADGPIHLFHTAFPLHPMSMMEAGRLVIEPVLLNNWPNAIPSLHTTWVLLAFWNSRGTPWWVRSLAFSFVAFTVLATLGTGEHYLVDLVVAFPFALMIQALCSFRVPWKSWQRRVPLLGGLGITLAWFGLLSFCTNLFWISPVIPWAMIAATITGSAWLVRFLSKPVTEAQSAAQFVPGAVSAATV